MAARRNPARKSAPDMIERARAAAAPERRPLPADSLAARHGRLAAALWDWERTDDESDTAWGLFVLWRELPPHERSYARVAELARRDGRDKGRDPRAVSVFAQRYRWTERAREYDRHLDRVTVAQTVESRKRLAAHLAQVGDVAVALVAHELGRTLQAARDGAPVMTPGDIARIAERFIPVAYRARDLPEHTGADHTVERSTVILGHNGRPVEETAISANSDAATPSAGLLADDPDFRAVILAAQARITAARQGPPAAIDVPAHLVHEAEPDDPDPVAEWDLVPDDLDDDDEDGETDPLVSMA